MIVVRSILFNVVFYLVLFVYLIAAMPTLLMPRGALLAMVKNWSRLSLWLLKVICNIGCEFRGLENIPKGAALIVVGEVTLALPLAGIIDMDAERKRLEKEIAQTASDTEKAEAWLANEANVAKSPEHVVALNRKRVSDGSERLKRLTAALKRIEA